ncbi:MAG: hypothetical protein WCJ61_08690, partial [Paludibacter sp.]
MKITLHTKKLKFILLLVTVLVGQMALAFDIVSYALTSNLTSTSVDIPANAGKAFSTTSSGTISYGGSILQNSGWNGSGKYWQTAAFSTFGYHTIGVSAVMKSDNNTGPKDFRLNYSIDNGANWSSTAIATYSITGVAGIVYTGALPQACQNQNSVMLRWTNYTTIAVNKTTAGTVTSLGKSYISTVSITGYQPIVPSSQANNITIVSRTPTTITVGWTKGINGDSVVVMMNTTNDFTPVPINDQSFTAMTGTYTSGRQVIYVGTKSIFTVNVTSATDQYYFRVFDYIPNNGMYRYITTSSDPGNGGVVKNPILCALENIHINPAIDIRLNRATLGATITATKKSAISERAIYWDINPGVSELTGNKISDFINEDGSYSFPVGEITRGSTIYFVASVKNESGTIWSSEESFINTPIFTGTGNWETAARWNVQEVPGSNGDATYGSVDDSPFIEGDCTLNDTTRCNILTITAGNRLTIQPSKSLEVIGDLINDAGTSGLVIKADSTDANGSLIFPQGLTTVPATVEMYSKASWNGSLSNLDNNKYKWQYFGIPVDTLPANPTFYGGYVRYWEETGDNITNHWLPMTTTSKLSPFVGYEICQIRPKIYTFNGNLVNRDFSQTDLAYTTSALYPGQHIFANPYTAAINISALAGAFGKNMEEAVYLYNAGTYSQWEASNGAGKNDSTTTNPGQYTVSTPLSAGRANIGVPTQIPSMQAFLVKAKSNIPLNDSLAFSYANVVGINT